MDGTTIAGYNIEDLAFWIVVVNSRTDGLELRYSYVIEQYNTINATDATIESDDFLSVDELALVIEFEEGNFILIDVD